MRSTSLVLFRLKSRAIVIGLISTLIMGVALSEIRAQTAPNGSSSIQYLQKTRVAPQLREALKKLGGRLESPGQERVVVSGILTRYGGSQVEPNPYRMTIEYPGRMRLEEQVGGHQQVLVFNGVQVANLNGVLNREDEDLIETLIFDSVDHFFVGQMQSLPFRFLGSRFRWDDGTTRNYSGPYFDVYQFTDRYARGSGLAELPKLYFINSDTQFLERIRHGTPQTTALMNIEIQIQGWKMINGYYFPGSITRFENSRKIFTMSFDTATVAARNDDGIFDPAQGH